MRTYTADDCAREFSILLRQDFGPNARSGAFLTGHDGKRRQSPAYGNDEWKLIEPKAGASISAHAVAVSSRFSMLAVGTDCARIHLYLLPSLELSCTLRTPASIVDQISFSPDEQWLLANCRSQDYKVERGVLFSIPNALRNDANTRYPNFAPVFEIESLTDRLSQTCAQFLDEAQTDNRKISSSFNPSTEHRKNLRQAAEALELEFAASQSNFKGFDGLQLPPGHCGSVVWHPQSTHFLLLRELPRPQRCNGTPSDVCIFAMSDVDEKKEFTEVLTLKGHTDAIMTASWSSDGKTLFTSCWDQKVRVWEASSGTLLHTLQDDASNQSWTAKMSNDGKFLAAGNGDGRVRVWNVATGTLAWRFPTEEEDAEELDSKETCDLTGQTETKRKIRRGWFRAVQWSHDSSRLWIGNEGGVRMYNVGVEPPKREQGWLFDTNAPRSFIRNYEVPDIELSQDDKRVLIPLGNGHRTVYDVSENVKWEVEQYDEQSERLSSYGDVRFLDDKGTTFASVDREGRIRIWKLVDDAK